MTKNQQEIPALKVEQISVYYEKTPVLWDISTEIPSGKLIGIIGPNGAGKTTFIKTILGLLQPMTGHIEVLGSPLKKGSPNIAYVPQRESIDWNFPITVFDLVLMGRYGHIGLFRWPRKADKEAAKHALEMVGMLDYAKRQISELSGGQQQRIFLARAIAQNPSLYLMDEPFAGLDLGTEKILVNLLKELRDSGKTILIVHHDLSSVETYFDWIVMLNMRLVASGPTEKYFNEDNLGKTFGKNNILLNEVLKITRKKSLGIS